MTPELRRALQLHQSGQASAALPLYARALAQAPDDQAALYYGAIAARVCGDPALAIARLDRLSALTPHPVAELFYQRGLAHSDRGNAEPAIADFRAAIRCKPQMAAAHNDLGNLLRQRGDFSAAGQAFADALAADPEHFEARYNRGLNALQSGNLALARQELADCLERNPESADVRATLVDVLLDCGEREEARRLARASVGRLPAAPQLWNALGQAEEACGDPAAALAAYRKGLECAPDDVTLALNLGLLEGEDGDFESACARYDRIAMRHDHDGARLRRATLLPSIPDSEEHIDRMRGEFRAQLAALREQGLTLQDPLNDYGCTPFYLSYHGRDDDRVLLGELAATLRGAAPALTFTAPHIGRPRRTGKWRVGFCSHFLFDHSVGRAVHAFIAALSPDEFDVHILSAPPFVDDPLARRIRSRAQQHALPFELKAARDHIATLELDALVYPEIGMDALTYFLAFARLAPVQWTTFGHPCTSGLDSIDTYVSQALLEPPGSERFYSESLRRLPEGGVFPDYPGTALPPRLRSRAELGLPATGSLLICPQSPFKLMPQFDRTLAEILIATPDAQLLLPSARMGGLTELLKARFARSLGPHARRVACFPWRSREAFVELIAACDLLLDPFPVGGGITTWDALAAGTPIVTRPSDAMRSRFATAALTLAGQARCGTTIAADAAQYVGHATRLLNSPDERRALRQTLSRAAPDIYRDRRVVEPFVAALREAIGT